MALNQYRLLGQSGLRVSPISFGTQTFGLEWGHGCSKSESRHMFDYYVDCGGNLFDTSNVYNFGTAEKYLGEFIQGRRDQLVISTKYTMNDDRKNPNAGGNHRKNLVRSLEGSLTRLQTDYVDLLWIHAWDFRTPVEEVLRALDDLVRQGKILHIGISNAPALKIAEANAIAELRGWTSFVGIQIQYNLLERSAERDIIPYAREHNVAVLPWSPLAGGLLTGAFTKKDLLGQGTKEINGVAKQDPGKLRLLDEKNIAVVQKLVDLAKMVGKTPSQVALNWLLHKPGVTSVIVGANSLEQLKENLQGVEFELDQKNLARLDSFNEPDMGNAHYFRDEKVFRTVIDGNMDIERPFYEMASQRKEQVSIFRPKKWSENDLSFSAKTVYYLKQGIKKVIQAINPTLNDRIVDSLYIKRLNRNSLDLHWQPAMRSRFSRLDAAGIQIKDKLFVFGGYKTIDEVLNEADIFDLSRGVWAGHFEMPKEVAQSHLGIAQEADRYVYLISGQHGPQASPAITDCFVLDIEQKTWNKLPPLPEPRYAPAVQLWRGRLHVVGGAKEDRYSSAQNHWSLAVKDGKAIENKWRVEKPIPRGGMHRPSAILNDCLYVFSGQEGDWVADPGDKNYTAVPPLKPEIPFKDTFMLDDPQGHWARKADMIMPASQTEFAVIQVDSKIAILGGMKDKNPETHVIEMTDAIQVYDPDTDHWEIAGTLPYRVKSTVAAYHNKTIYFTTGQRDRGPDNPAPGPYVNFSWKAGFKLSSLRVVK